MKEEPQEASKLKVEFHYTIAYGWIRPLPDVRMLNGGLITSRFC